MPGIDTNEAQSFGSFWLLFLYDVCEEIDLDRLRQILGSSSAGRAPSFARAAPDYVRFERPPVVERSEPVDFDGHQLRGEINYYDYGVVAVRLQLPFAAAWPELVERSSRLLNAPELEAHAAKLARAHLDRVRTALIKPHDTPENWLQEDYMVVHFERAPTAPLKAKDLFQRRGADIAKIVRGESINLAKRERDEILGSRMSYYEDDLLVVGWAAAFIYDNAEGAAPAIQLLEYANTQLLEFRYYDRVLTRVLQEVYKSLDERGGFWDRWKMARQARQLNTIRLDVRELTERADTAIKFLSDMFFARVYHLAADRVGVSDYRRLVDDKLETSASLYDSMMDQFHQGRAFVLELIVVVILLIELVFLFRGIR
jgi:hypothetical protein